ncbi:MAG: N-formylglutamate amidohydrolase [Alphaproteobacteria bacterium]|nr:N-formylglutamate amidohydrolase [Alphaproteobacteria bacterium]
MQPVDIVPIPGPRAEAAAPPCLVVEVPHGADRSADFHRLAGLLRGPLPADLIDFFHVNTDVGAWALGVRVAERVVAARPTRAALALRCRVPRTFVDCNRVLDAKAAAEVTPGLHGYIRDPADKALLIDLHRRYQRAVAQAITRVCGAGGLALLPHSYAPRSVDLTGTEDDLPALLRGAWAPGTAETWPLRASVDLITETPEGLDQAIPGAAAALTAGFGALGLDVAVNGTYTLHPATWAAAHAARWPGRTLCLELRRDLLVEAWTPFAEMQPDPTAIDRLAAPVAAFLDEALRARGL